MSRYAGRADREAECVECVEKPGSVALVIESRPRDLGGLIRLL